MKRLLSVLIVAMILYCLPDLKVDAAFPQEEAPTAPTFLLEIREKQSEAGKYLVVELLSNDSIKDFGAGSGNLFVQNGSGADATEYFACEEISSEKLLDMTVNTETWHWGASAKDFINGDSVEAGVWVTYTLAISDSIPDDTYTFCMSLGTDFINVQFEPYSCAGKEIQAALSLGYSEPLYGDLTGDGVISREDAIQLFQMVSKGSKNIEKGLNDINQDGIINNRDAILLFRMAASAK